MAPFRIFYAWQSDRPANLCRRFIRKALDDAAEQLQDDLAIDDASRVEVEIDQDTEGEAGSPHVAETIFRKIRESDAFVADLTYTGKRADEQESPVPNPNVLIEYGYALSELKHERIIAVFNEEFGSCDDLPFDIKHRRWPISYLTSGDLSNETAPEARRAERKKLTRLLARAIKTIVQSEGKRERDSSTAKNRPLVEEFPLSGGVYLGNSAERLNFSTGAKILLTLRASRGGLTLTNNEARDVVLEALEPLASQRLFGRSPARVPNGAAIVKSPGPGSAAVEFASILQCDGRLFGIDCYHVGRHRQAGEHSQPIVPIRIVEEILEEGLRNFLHVSGNKLQLALPLEVGVALEGVNGYLLTIDQGNFFDDNRWPILVDRIEDRFQIGRYDADPAQVLKRFFERIYDKAGLKRT